MDQLDPWIKDQFRINFPPKMFPPIVTKLYVIDEDLSILQAKQFHNCMGKIVDGRAFPSWSRDPRTNLNQFHKHGNRNTLPAMTITYLVWTFLYPGGYFTLTHVNGHQHFGNRIHTSHRSGRHTRRVRSRKCCGSRDVFQHNVDKMFQNKPLHAEFVYRTPSVFAFTVKPWIQATL